MCECKCYCEWVSGWLGSSVCVWVRTWLSLIRGCHLCVYVRVWMEDVLGGLMIGWMSKNVKW